MANDTVLIATQDLAESIKNARLLKPLESPEL
jgi:hypothetical protein